MLTREQIIEMAETHKRSKWSQVEFSADDAARSFELGATWANEQNAAEIARLEAEKAEIMGALRLLFDEQNDAPLEKRREQWEYAYKIAGVILKKYEK